jgi:hypothetical protein
MKTLLNTIAFVAIAALLLASNSFAASDYLLELDGVKGEAKGKKIKLAKNADGSFSATNIPGGTYKLIYAHEQPGTQVAPSQVKVIVMAFEGIVSPHDDASGQTSGKRDAASGLPTGKRQHKPFVVTKEIDKTSPKSILGEIIIGDVDEDGATDHQGEPVHGVVVKRGYDLKINKKV